MVSPQSQQIEFPLIITNRLFDMGSLLNRVSFFFFFFFFFSFTILLKAYISAVISYIVTQTIFFLFSCSIPLFSFFSIFYYFLEFSSSSFYSSISTDFRLSILFSSYVICYLLFFLPSYNHNIHKRKKTKQNKTKQNKNTIKRAK